MILEDGTEWLSRMSVTNHRSALRKIPEECISSEYFFVRQENVYVLVQFSTYSLSQIRLITRRISDCMQVSIILYDRIKIITECKMSLIMWEVIKNVIRLQHKYNQA